MQASGAGDLGSGEFVDASFSFGLKNPEDGGTEFSVDVLTEALGDGLFLFDSGNTGRDGDNNLKTGAVDGTLSGDVGFELALDLDGVLSGISSLNADLLIDATSPDWFTGPPSLGDPLGIGTSVIAFDGLAGTVFTLAVPAAPARRWP